MDTLADLVARERRSDDVALRVDARDREYSYRDFCTTAWKAGHALSHLGVHAGSAVALAPEPAPQPLLTLFGAACLGARVTFETTADARAVVVPAERVGDIEDRPSRKVVVYGDAPTDPSVAHWERTVWSENPVMPPGDHAADETVLVGRDWSFTHGEVLTAAEAVVDAAGLDSASTVALRAPLTDPRAVVAGVIAPLVAGGAVVVPTGEATTADVSVVANGADGDGADDGATYHVANVPL
ncbi:AMP-binding protein [Haloplanus aerogenes]|uniref:AMP-binding enzyme n=1 Tax=Haloplanus aerogenes TaxID=660522 RepID=A0A3M0DUB6_9EURY|nr:AMP-binding protein [Haloplanus aerogenes]AZH25826.1 acetyl-CoA synthetase [Haloplanus aerogenes]RMB25569.1 AMP-binding enzyme [Haloplanus aerogenes]